MRPLYDANVETGAPANCSSPWWAAELSSSQLFALYSLLLLPRGQEHIFSSLSIPARLNTHSRFPLGTENLLAWSKSESLFSCLNPIAFSKVATGFSEQIERKSSPLHTCVTHRGWACKICNGSLLPPLSQSSFLDLTRQWLICPLQWVWLTSHYLSLLKMLFDLGSKSSLCRAFFSSGKQKNEMENKGVPSPELITICQGLVGVWVCLRFCSLPII